MTYYIEINDVYIYPVDNNPVLIKNLGDMGNFTNETDLMIKRYSQEGFKTVCDKQYGSKTHPTIKTEIIGNEYVANNGKIERNGGKVLQTADAGPFIMSSWYDLNELDIDIEGTSELCLYAIHSIGVVVPVPLAPTNRLTKALIDLCNEAFKNHPNTSSFIYEDVRDISKKYTGKALEVYNILRQYKEIFKDSDVTRDTFLSFIKEYQSKGNPDFIKQRLIASLFNKL
jgi:hypothetical protein